MKENRTMPTCNRLDLQTLGSQPIMPKNISDHMTHITHRVNNVIQHCTPYNKNT